MNIYEKLANVQAALKAPKGQRNTFGNYNYRSCEDIVEAVKPLLKENGLLLNLTDDLVLVGDRYYIKATAMVYDIENGGCHGVTAFAREEESKKGMDGSQVTGASSSYARKYALNGLFAIDDTKDSDATNTHGKDAPKETKPETKKDGPKMTPRQMLIARLNELGIDVNAFAKANNLNGKTDPETFTRLLKELENA
jgi:hypothetical protein